MQVRPVSAVGTRLSVDWIFKGVTPRCPDKFGMEDEPDPDMVGMWRDAARNYQVNVTFEGVEV